MEEVLTFIGVVVELADRSYVYYFGKAENSLPERHGPFASKALAESALHEEFESAKNKSLKEGEPIVKKLEYLKENPNEDTLAILENLYRL